MFTLLLVSASIVLTQEPKLNEVEQRACERISRLGGNFAWVREDAGIELACDLQNNQNAFDLNLFVPLKRLFALRIFGGGIDARSFAALRKVEKLGLLVIHSRGIGDRELGEIGKCRALVKLDVMGETISGTGIASLESLPHLEKLYLYRTRLKDADIVALRSFRNLKVVTLPKTVSTAAVAQLRKAMPGVDIDQM